MSFKFCIEMKGAELKNFDYLKFLFVLLIHTCLQNLIIFMFYLPDISYLTITFYLYALEIFFFLFHTEEPLWKKKKKKIN
jgi:hypothetical protein